MKIPCTKSWAIKVNFLMSCITSLASVSLYRGAAGGGLEKAVEGCENHPEDWDVLGQAWL